MDTRKANIAIIMTSAFEKALRPMRRPDLGTTARYRRDAPVQAAPRHLQLAKCGSLDLFEVTIDEMQIFMSCGQLTAESYTALCLERIRQVNQYLKAVIEVNPDAIEIARSLDAERKKGKTRSELHGIPVLVKDNIATKDRMQTTAGSWALLGSSVPRDAHVVRKLREAGAILLGHANMSEWASVRSTSYSTGYSPRGDQVRSPYDLSRSPNGSSSGSAVAISANIVPLALGTETDTSIIGPAQVAGIVGIKPTVGLTSRAGVIPISSNMDSVGSFGRTVADAVLGLNTIASRDERDPATSHMNCPRGVDYMSCIADRSSLKGAVFGLPIRRCWELVKPSHKAAAEQAIEAMRKFGAKVVDTDLPSWQERIPVDGNWDWEHGSPEQSEHSVVKVDAYNGINSYLAELDDTNVRTIEDVAQYNRDNAGSEGSQRGIHPAFPTGQDGFDAIIASKGRQDKVYQAALAYTRRKCREEGIDGALQQKSGRPFDALLFCDARGIGQQIAAQAGYPIITIPIGIDEEGIPVSLSLQHSAWREEELIKWASAIEDALKTFNPRRPLPQFRNATAKNVPIHGYG